MALYVTDTHPLVWYTCGHHARLSKRALSIFRDAESERALVYVPAAVLWEVALLERYRRTELAEPFESWAAAMLAQGGFEFAPLDLPVIATACALSFTRDLFDAAIVATARVKDLPLITKDAKIQEARLVEVAW